MTAIALVQSAGTSAWIVQILPIVAIVGIFYFVVIGPANRQRRKTETMLSALKKGDRVLLSSGIYGSVQSVENDIVYLKIAENTKVKVAKSAIASVVNDSVAE
jgi:preprotein translocase subunit YajC